MGYFIEGFQDARVSFDIEDMLETEEVSVGITLSDNRTKIEVRQGRTIPGDKIRSQRLPGMYTLLRLGTMNVMFSSRISSALFP